MRHGCLHGSYLFLAGARVLSGRERAAAHAAHMLARARSRAPGRQLERGLQSDAERLVRLKQHATLTLTPLLHAEGVRSIVKAGDAGVIGLLWIAADVVTDDEGRVADAEYERFIAAARDALSSVTQDLTNTSVINALLLTIVLPLALTGGGSAGSFEDEQQLQQAPTHPAWSDAATYLTSSAADAASLRRIFFAVESVLLFTSVAIAFGALFFSVSMLRLMGVIGHRVLPRCELVVASSSYFSVIGVVWSLGLLTLALALPLVAARYSAIAFFSSFAVMLFFSMLQCLFTSPSKAATKLVRLEAARVLGTGSAGEPGSREGELAA